MEQTLDQLRAKDAFLKIKNVTKNQTQHDKYLSYVNALPATILMNGLGQAMASLLAAAKGKEEEHKCLYNHVTSWLCRNDEDAPYSSGDLLENITKNDEDYYLHAQAEALAYLEWLKKFANAFLEKKKDSGDEVTSL